MPAKTPRAGGAKLSPTTRPNTKFVADALADNLRAYRLLNGLDQQYVADRMRRLGHPWRRVTVSEVERGLRNVTVPELLTLVLVFGATVEELLDPRRPDQRGSGVVWLELNAETPSVSIFAERLTALICRHKFDIGGPITLADDVSSMVISGVQSDDEAQQP
jgi:transcriptional regulator with XRE-family HTH domain